MKYGNQHLVTKSFYDWCVENDRMDLNDRFDTDKNQCTTKDVGYKSNLKWWFKCPRQLHESEQYVMHFVTNNKNRKLICRMCNSVAQVIIDKFGKEYLDNHWHADNIVSPWQVAAGSSITKVIIQCSNKDYHIYEQVASSFVKGVGCPYCINKIVHPNDSIAVLFPDILNRWSDKNDKLPYGYSVHSEKKVWLTCPSGKHKDYMQQLNHAFVSEYRCPSCSLEEKSQRMRGDGTHFWRGGINGENDTLRHRREYKEWRTAVYERDDYTCQCCGNRGGKLNAYHINRFSEHPDLRYDIQNGITLCANCHDSTIEGSFHNVNGTHNITAKQLRDYILNKSKKDIYITHPDLLYKI